MTTPENDRPATPRTTDVGEPAGTYADDPARTTDLGEADRTYADEPARTTDLGEADRTYADEPARTTDLGEADRTYADEPARTTDLGEADRTSADDPARTTGVGEVDPTYADEADRAAYGNAHRLEEGERTTADSTGDALDRPADALDGQRAPMDDVRDEQRGSMDDRADAASTPEVSPEDPLVPDDVAVDFKARWDVIQQGFVDDPRIAVTDADKLVGDVLQRLSATFDRQHQSLEGQWSDGEPSTEDLRGALQRYRAFFDRLVSL